MTTNEDIRWKQRFSNFKTALKQLEMAVELFSKRKLSDLEKQGLIHAFDYTHELAWNVLKDYFEYQSGAMITGSRDATREAFSKGIIDSGQLWMEMIQSRNQSSHTYNLAIAEEIVHQICENYFGAFEQLKNKMSELANQ